MIKRGSGRNGRVRVDESHWFIRRGREIRLCFGCGEEKAMPVNPFRYVMARDAFEEKHSGCDVLAAAMKREAAKRPPKRGRAKGEAG